jgi:hypothetical protein
MKWNFIKVKIGIRATPGKYNAITTWRWNNERGCCLSLGIVDDISGINTLSLKTLYNKFSRLIRAYLKKSCYLKTKVVKRNSGVCGAAPRMIILCPSSNNKKERFP